MTCVCIYIYTHIYTCLYIYTYIYAYIYMYTNVCIYTRIHIYIYICMYSHIYIHVHTPQAEEIGPKIITTANIWIKFSRVSPSLSNMFSRESTNFKQNFIEANGSLHKLKELTGNLSNLDFKISYKSDLLRERYIYICMYIYVYIYRYIYKYIYIYGYTHACMY